jgi:hypothetical protein
VRAEAFSPSGERTSSEEFYRTEAEFSVFLPDDPNIVELKIYQPQWTGSSFILELVGETVIP